MDNKGPKYQKKEERFQPTARREVEERPLQADHRPSSFRPHPRYPRLNAAEAPSERARKMRQAQIQTLKKAEKPQSVVLESSVPTVNRQAVRNFSRTLKRDVKTGRIPLLIALVIVIGLGYWLLTAPNFRVTNVKVTGSRYLDAQGVINFTGVNQQNVFLLSEDEIAKKIKEKPFVLDAKVSKALPNELRVEITERKTRLVWKVGSMNYMVDPDGVILESSTRLTDDASNLTIINSLDGSQLQAGKKVDPVAVASAEEILTKMNESGIKVASLDYSPTTGLIVVSAGPDGKPGAWKALFGTNAELEKKANLLKALLARNDLKWTFVDLRFTDKPAIS